MPNQNDKSDKSNKSASATTVPDVPVLRNEVIEIDSDEATPLADAHLAKGSFSVLGAFGLAFSVINSWVVLVAALGSGLVSGGPSVLVWGYVYASICNYAVVLSHCEILAVYPTAAGQYHWAAILSPPSIRRPLSWITGMLNVIGLWLGAASAAYLSTVCLLSIIAVNVPDFAITPEQQYGVFAAIIVVGPAITMIVGPKANRLVDTGLMILSVLGVSVIVITLLAKAETKAPASWVFGGTSNYTGWDSLVIAWLLGLLQSSFAYLGFDLVYHVSEEMSEPRVEGPKAVKWTIIISAISGLIAIIAVLFCVADPDAVLATAYILPFAQICMDATQSNVATSIFLFIPFILLVNSVRGVCMTGARVLLALGRDNVLPKPTLWQWTFRSEPIAGTVLCVLVPLVCGVVQLGSAAAFSSLLGGAVFVFEISYAIPAVLMLLGGRKQLNKDHPDRLSNLGKWGVPCNLIATFFVVQSCVIYCFPSTIPVSAANMSYVSLFAGFFCIALGALWWLYAKNRYIAPTKESILAQIAGRNHWNTVEEL